MSGQGGAERRREVRIRSANLINYSAEHANAVPEKQFYAVLGVAETRDLSARGCRLRTHEPLPVGVELTFDLQLMDQIIHCRGKIVRGGEAETGVWEAGVEFKDLDDMAKDGIRLYLEFKDGAEEA